MRKPFWTGLRWRWVARAVIGICALASGTRCPAQTVKTAQPQIMFVFPAGGQRGKAVEAIVVGAGLKGATAVYVAGKGVTARIVPEDGAAPAPEPEKPLVPEKNPRPWINTPKPWINAAALRVGTTSLVDSVRISLVIASDADLGQRDLRLVTPAGISSRCRFVVDDLPEVLATRPCASREKAMLLESLPVVVEGQIYSGKSFTPGTGTCEPDRAYYRIPAKAGQTLVCQCEAQALCPYMKFAVPGWFDACLTLYDADGNWLAYADDFRFHPDPVLSYKVPKDGEYLLEIRDVLHRGGHDYIYRLRMGALPFVTHVFPLGGRRGTEVDLELHGVNLSAEKLRWKAPADGAEAQTTGVRDGKSNGLPLAAGDLPETTEVEPNDSSAKAQRVTLPITINGRIQTSGDEDYFVFKVEEGRKLVMEVNARCLDSPLDSVLTLFDAAGRKLAEDDDPVPQGVRAENVVEARVENDRSFHTEPRDALTTHTADSRLVYTFAKAGDYVVRIHDAQDRGGDEYAYRLTIAPARPDYVLRIHTDGLRVAQGSSGVLAVSALRKNDCDGEIQLAVGDLPPGVTASGAAFPPKVNELQLTITAAPDAKPGVYCPTIVGTFAEGGAACVRKACPVEKCIQAFYVPHFVPLQSCPVEVTPGGMLSLLTDVPQGKVLELKPKAETKVVVKAVRTAEAKFPVTVTLAEAIRVEPISRRPQPPIGVKEVTIPADKDEATITLRAETLAEGTYNVILAGTMNAGKQAVTCVAPAVRVKVFAAAGAPSAR